MWAEGLTRCSMLGTFIVARCRLYLRYIGGYIILYSRERETRGGKELETSVGTVLGGRYRVQSTLGAGGMAVVYRAEDAILGRTVALKTLHRRYAEMPSFRRRFRQEARAMACLDHENIVKVYDISQDGEVPFIVVECVVGRDIGSLLSGHQGGCLNERFVRRMAAQLLRALSYAHRRGVIHRDIKPSNILVTASGTVKVADFGIARIVEEDGAGDGEAGEVVGSARYMAPEQLMGRDATPRTDVYSVGVLLYHCLTGRPPFSGDLKSLARQHIHRAPTPPRRLNRRISPGMEAVILRALAKDPGDRYPSATAMLDDIEVEVLPAAGGTAKARRSGASRAGLILAWMLALLMLLGGGAALASGLGYVDLSSYKGVGEVLSRAEPVQAEKPPATPEPPAQQAQKPLATSEKSAATPPPEPELVPVPDVRAYFDYYAKRTLVRRGFDVRFVYGYRDGYANRGVTWATDPGVGTLAPKGSTVTVYATPENLPQPRF
jgi:eukaryotic-like serine/threonine-protein kinase